LLELGARCRATGLAWTDESGRTWRNWTSLTDWQGVGALKRYSTDILRTSLLYSVSVRVSFFVCFFVVLRSVFSFAEQDHNLRRGWYVGRVE
jgi:hypothetical protein